MKRFVLQLVDGRKYSCNYGSPEELASLISGGVMAQLSDGTWLNTRHVVTFREVPS